MKETAKAWITRALVWEAKRAILRHKPRIVMVAGSVGKTSTKDMAAAVIGVKKRVRKSEKSFNSEIGVPLAILGLENGWGNPIKWLLNLWKGWRESGSPDFPEVLVLEVGADHPGDVKHILSWVRPEASIVTSFPDTPVHVEFFASREALWDEDAEVIRALPRDGVLVMNGDDKNLARYESVSPAPVARYGTRDDATVFGKNIRPFMEGGVPRGMEMDVTEGSRSARVRIPRVLGPQLCYSALAALAVGLRFDISITEGAAAIASAEPPKGRMRLFSGVNDSTLIDDTYNSSPIALEAALRAVESLETGGKKIAVLGDMRELGGYSVQEHQKAGVLAGNVCDVVIGVGESAKDLVESAKGKRAQVLEWCPDAESAGKSLVSRVGKGDIVLVKGSQGVRMEKCSAMLLAHKEDSKDLPRQERAWKNR
jgi:UDP-N-acetylmuramoyl-tripeptide--D-alanyl-D-alanine ligase